MDKIKKVVLKSLLTIAAVIFVCLIIFAAVKLPAVFGKDDGLLEIVYSGTGSMGSYAKYTISDNTILI